MWEAIFYPDGSSYFGEYTRKSDGRARSLTGNALGAERALEALRDKFKEASKPLWCRACFTMQSDGSFKLESGYDGCDENGNARFDEEEELKRVEERRKRLSAQ